jgi:cell wall-associated NlpC family hydrolase
LTFSKNDLSRFACRVAPLFALSLLSVAAQAVPQETTATATAKLKADNVNLRDKPSTDGVSKKRLSLGERFQILATKDGWHKIKMTSGEIGWIRSDMAAIEKKLESVKPQPKSTKADPDEDESTISVILKTGDEGLVDDSEDTDSITRSRAAADQTEIPQRSGRRYGRGSIATTALAHRGARYVFGATGGHGAFDCSGFTQYLYQKQGVSIPRTAAEQFSEGTSVSREDLREGDLLFLKGTYKPGVSHVGMYIGNGEVIHAANAKRGVVLDSLERFMGRYEYAGARRYSKK